MSVSIIDFNMISPLGSGQNEHWEHLFNPHTPQYKLGKNEFELIDELFEPLQFHLKNISPERVAVVVSNSKYNFGRYIQTAKRPELDFLPHALSSYLASKVGKGAIPYAISAACATGLISVIKGCEFLLDQTVDMVIAGSIETSKTELMEAAFDRMGVLSKSQQMSPFSKDRDGFILGEGGGLFILCRTNDIQNTYAKIAGFSSVNDATNPIQFDPQGLSIKHAIQQAMRKAHVEEVQYVNAHGTATPQNDQLEADVFHAVFQGENKPYISSTKSYTGHLLGATGSVELGLCVLALKHRRVIPPRKLENPMPAITPFMNQTHTNGIKACLTLNYGFGGHVAAMVIC